MPRRRKRRMADTEEILPVRREDGTLDVTPYIAVLNIITKGKYLNRGRGFAIKQEIKDIRRCQ